jgi:predicted esterase
MFGSNKFFQVVSGFVAFGFTLLQGLDWLFKKYNLESKWFNYILLALFLAFVTSIFYLYVKSKKVVSNKPKTDNKKAKFIRIGNVVVTGLLLILFLYFFKKSQSKDDLLTEQLPEISNAFDKGDILFVFKKTKSLLENYPDNEILKNFFVKSSWNINVDSDLKETEVYVKFPKDTIWNYIGFTPIDSLRVPGLGEDLIDFTLKLKKGDVEYITEGEQYGYFEISLLKDVPPGFIYKKIKENINMNMPGVFLGPDNLIPSFGVSKTEVTNLQFKQFIEDGGYNKPKYWDFPFYFEGEEFTYDKTIKLFTDKFGKFGPANWIYGEFPDGEENFPVQGISWFEARAYAKYKELSLPNIFQWLDAASLSGFKFKLPNLSGSNFNSNKPRDVNESDNEIDLLPNIAGNVREWTNTSHGNNRKVILGGSYTEDEYTFNSFYSISPFDRSIENGIRLVKNLKEIYQFNDNFIAKYFERDFYKEQDVSDEVFEVYKSQFDYPNKPLDVVEKIIESSNKNYRIEKFEMPTPYKSEEKLYGYIISSKKFNDKTKPIIEFPSAWAIFSDDLKISDDLIKEKKYLLDEGYSIIMPVYYNTWEREKLLKDWWPNETEEYKSTIVKIGKDFKRVIDYLETKENLDFEKLSYMGYSWGSVTSNILLAIDNRISSASIFVGGLMLQKSRKEIESHLYVRRIKIPILHIVGKRDGIFEYEESFLPWNNLIGTPEKDKSIIVLEDVGHGLPKDVMVENHLNFLEKYN